MVLTYEQMTEMEVLKQKHKLAIMAEENVMNVNEHKRKMERLNKQLEIAQAEAKKEKKE
tara:strand:- start:821 stop:997 length:177 start_codon:yes stop_codon:yes gene_type:complete